MFNMTCPICGKLNKEIEPEKSYGYFRCISCGMHVSTNPFKEDLRVPTHVMVLLYKNFCKYISEGNDRK